MLFKFVINQRGNSKKKNCQQLFDEWNKKEHSISQRAAMTLINRTRYTFEVNTDVHGGQA